MSLKELKTNGLIAGKLAAAIEGGKAFHATLLVGPQDSRLKLGREFAKALLCTGRSSGDSCGVCSSCRKFDRGNQEDYIFLNLENAPGSAKTQIGVEAVEYLQERLKLKPFGSRTVALMDQVHFMTVPAQNKLLKTLEEPLGSAAIILLSESRDSLLSTVLSRCSAYQLEDEKEIVSDRIKSAVCALASAFIEKGPFYVKKKIADGLLEDKNLSREDAAAFVRSFELLCRDALMAATGAKCPFIGCDGALSLEMSRKLKDGSLMAAIKAAEEAGTSLKLGYSAAFVLKRLCLDI